MIFVASHFLSAKVSPEWRLNLGFGTQKKCPFPLNRGVPSIEVTKQKLCEHFSRSKFCVPFMEVSLKVSVKENEVPTEKNSSRASIFATKVSYISN